MMLWQSVLIFITHRSGHSSRMIGLDEPGHWDFVLLKFWWRIDALKLHAPTKFLTTWTSR